MKEKTRYKKPAEVTELEFLYHEFKKEKYPSTPTNYLPLTKFRDDKTNDLTKCVIAYTKVKGYFIERISSTGRYQGGRWIKGSGTKGTADLSAVINGRAVKIEIKCAATNDRQSADQRKYQQQVEKAGAIYIIVRRFKDYFNWLNDFTNESANNIQAKQEPTQK